MKGAWSLTLSLLILSTFIRLHIEIDRIYVLNMFRKKKIYHLIFPSHAMNNKKKKTKKNNARFAAVFRCCVWVVLVYLFSFFHAIVTQTTWKYFTPYTWNKESKHETNISVCHHQHHTIEQPYQPYFLNGVMRCKCENLWSIWTLLFNFSILSLLLL